MELSEFLTVEEFERLAARTRMHESGVIMARRVLVDGLSAAKAGREIGKSRALASRAVNTIRAAARRDEKCPMCGRDFQCST